MLHSLEKLLRLLEEILQPLEQILQKLEQILQALEQELPAGGANAPDVGANAPEIGAFAPMRWRKKRNNAPTKGAKCSISLEYSLEYSLGKGTLAGGIRARDGKGAWRRTLLNSGWR
jgi:hypothetical protein